MFEHLDDTERFEPSEAFYRRTDRRFVIRCRRRTGLRLAGTTACLAVAAPALFSTYASHRPASTGSVVPAPTDSTTASAVVDDTPADTSAPHDTSPAADPGAQNFLIVGADNNACVGADSPYAGAFGDRTGQRSDTIMVLRLDPASAHAAILSFPRDLYVDIPEQGKGRINGAYRRDDPQLLIDTLLDEFGVPVDHFIQIDFCAFTEIVDAVHGVAVPLLYAVRDTNTGLNVATPGCHTFSGDEALAYVRSRHFEYLDEATGQWQSDSSSDRGRVARQQDFVRRTLTAVLRGGLLQPELITGLYSTYRHDVVVDTGLTLAKVLEYARALGDISPAGIRSYQIEATGRVIAGADVLVFNNTPNMSAILDIFRGIAPLAVAPASANAPDTAAPPADSAPVSDGPVTAIVPDAAIDC
jgi:LCP family protein required for cell wall assembly